MLFLRFEDAWAVYLRAHPRLPSPPPPVTPRRVSGLLEVVEEGTVDLVVFDAYGVLHIGGEAFPSSVAAFAALRRRGVPVCVVTNDVSREPARVADGLNRRGYDFRADEVISGRSLLPDVLAETAGQGRLGLISSHPAEVLARFPDLLPMGWEAAPYDTVDGFVMIDVNDWDDARPAMLEDAQARRPRPMVVCNSDVACPYGEAISLEPGYTAHRIAEATGAAVTFLGKPFPEIYDRVLDRFPDIAPDRMLMVGDSPHTDVLGGRGAGMKCLLVECGFLRGRDTLALCAEAGLWPDYVAATC